MWPGLTKQGTHATVFGQEVPILHGITKWREERRAYKSGDGRAAVELCDKGPKVERMRLLSR